MSQSKTTSSVKSVVPAVVNALNILDYLAHVAPEARVSDIARDLKINKSTCFNILATLQAAQVVVKHPIYSSYRLGSKLIDLGGAARRNLSQGIGLAEKMRELADEIHLTCVLGQVLADGSGMVIIDRAVPHRSDIMVLSIGHIVSMKGPAMGRAVLASRDDTEALELARRSGLLPRGGESELIAQLDAVRSLGYATSLGERDPNVNAVAVVAGGGSGNELVLCVVGFQRHFPKSRVPAVGKRMSVLRDTLRDNSTWAQAS